ncbi:thioredoxin [Alkalicaulis satelles]|uniref:Thioredoxin n=1 Tax=Alkalicaulis satelles TaxID=2609175 RepID=A0A5M6ZD71_9PROT|nr:thioredoxin [Alkalicaulis satelles]KAA5802265.1 thioredoxin [Alkalicaulis satelles]
MEIIGAGGQPQTQPQAGADGDGLIREGTDQSFMADVIEPSKTVPVLVDFWAPWCGPCRQLTPVIEAAVRAAKGAVKLVKINIDENPGIAGQLRIQSIPAVFAFQNGQPVDGFMGALPESQIKQFIARLAGDVDEGAIEELIARAEAALAEGDLGGAAQDFAQALQMDKESAEAIAGLARVSLISGDADQARALLDSAPEAKKTHPALASVRASMELAGEVEGADDLAAAEARAGKAAKDPEAQFSLARARLAAGDMTGSVDALLASITLDRDWNEAAARQLLLRIFDAAGPASELAKTGRRRLSSILFA